MSFVHGSTLSIEELLAEVEIAARIGGSILRERWARPHQVEFKGQINLVIDADRASETAIVEHLRVRFPFDDIIAEEGAPQVHQGPRRWYIDPLDGTTNYAHGVPHFCVSIGVEDETGLAAGVVHQPLTGELFKAGRGFGAWLGAERLAVSDRAPLSQALVGTGFPYDIWEKPERPLKLFADLLTHARGVRRAGAAALDLAYVAAGRFDAFLELGLKPWDVAAGIVLVREAGG